MIGGGAVVALLSVFLAAGCTRLRSRMRAWALSLGGPLLIAYCVYWTPVWMGEDSSEYSAWWPIFIGPWYLLGATVSALVMYFASAPHLQDVQVDCVDIALRGRIEDAIRSDLDGKSVRVRARVAISDRGLLIHEARLTHFRADTLETVGTPTDYRDRLREVLLRIGFAIDSSQ